MQTLSGTGLFGDSMVVNARCDNCRKWKTGSLNLKDKSQPWIFALGPTTSVSTVTQSDSKSESIERHSEYGKDPATKVIAAPNELIREQGHLP